MEDKVRVHTEVMGRVQGVFFRDNTKKKAEELGIFGWVRNLPDGSLEAVFEGDKEEIKQMLDWIKEGPSQARVKEVKIQFQDFQDEFENFEIRH